MALCDMHPLGSFQTVCVPNYSFLIFTNAIIPYFVDTNFIIVCLKTNFVSIAVQI
jgi:hypothetical protein